MEAKKSGSSERRASLEKVAMVGTYFQKTNSQCDNSCNYMESTGKEKKK
jgi:hypothetical protein